LEKLAGEKSQGRQGVGGEVREDGGECFELTADSVAGQGREGGGEGRREAGKDVGKGREREVENP
jgi:hypothetical protein